MKVIQKTATLEDDYRSALVIEKDWKNIIDFRESDEMHDNNLSRHFKDCYKIIDLLKEFYEMWKAWVDIQFSKKEDAHEIRD